MFYHPRGSCAPPHQPSTPFPVSSRCLPARIRPLASAITMGRGTTSSTRPSPHRLLRWKCSHILHLRISRILPLPRLVLNHCVPSSPLRPPRRRKTPVLHRRKTPALHRRKIPALRRRKTPALRRLKTPALRRRRRRPSRVMELRVKKNTNGSRILPADPVSPSPSRKLSD